MDGVRRGRFEAPIPQRKRGRYGLEVLVASCLLGLSVPLVVAGCSASERAPDDTQQTAFRVRSDAAAGLNADAGWAGAPGEDVTVYADQPFRIRFEVAGTAEAMRGQQFRLQYRRNDGPWTDAEAHDFPYPDAATPRVSVVAAAPYEHGAATADLLPGADAPFHAGAGVDLAAQTPPWSVGGGGRVHGEWEWPLVIRRFADGAVTNNAGDAFVFRMADAAGRPLGGATPVLTLTVPPGHVGGTFVETPGRIGPWQAANGDLYFIVEPTETDNVLMMVKSTDGGATWQEVDGANRPAADDLEGVASDRAGDTIYLLHQTSDQVWHHAFRTSDHPTAPDTWAIRDELVAAPPEPPVQVAALVARSDGSLVGAYGGAEKVRFKIRSPEGTWSEETVVDAGEGPNLSGPQAVLGAGDVVHLAYAGRDGTAWYRRIRPDGTLTPREQLATGLGTAENDVGAILPLVYIPETNTVVVIYRLSTGPLWERRIVDHAPPTDPVRVSDRGVVQNAVDSDQAGADAIADGTAVHVLFIEERTGHIYHTASDAAGDWRPPTLQVDGVDAQWVRGARLMRGDGAHVYGFVYDAGSDGGSGMNRFAEVLLGAR